MSDGGVIQFVIDLIFQPGSSLKLVPVINLAVLALLALLLAVAHTKIAAVHLVVLASLAVGLLLSVNWFYYEYQKVIRAQKGEGEGADAAAIAATAAAGGTREKTD